jgi:hypothetical protein
LSRNIFRKRFLLSQTLATSTVNSSKDQTPLINKSKESKIVNNQTDKFKDNNDELEDDNAENSAKTQKNILINSDVNNEQGNYKAKKKLSMTHLITLNLDKREETEMFGRIERDIPEKILSHNLDEPENMVKKDKKNCQQHVKRFHYKLQWMKRENGILPIPTYYSFEIIKKYYPQLLLDYFEDNETLIEVKKEKK